MRQPLLVGFVADSYDGPDMGMVAYAIRRAISTTEAVPLTQLLDWAHTQVSFMVHGAHDRQRVLESVSAIAARFGLPSTLARKAQEATGHLLDVSMAGAVTPSGKPLYDSNAASMPAHAIRVQVVLDASRLGVEVTDPFGTLTRADVFGGLLRAIQKPDANTSDQALHRVASSMSMMRFHSQPMVATRVAFLMPRTAALRQPVGTLLWEQHQARANPGLTPPP